MHHPQKSQGFSLVELSIVLVIVGLLTGGILMGQSLIRNAEIQSVIKELGKYSDAVVAFRDQYDALPGDLPDAGNYWGLVNATPATCESTASDGTLTCNGNGNGQIFIGIGGIMYSERWHAMIQLKNAGFISGKFNGLAGSGDVAHAVIGQNSPSFPASKSGMTITTQAVTSTSDANFFCACGRHALPCWRATLDRLVLDTHFYTRRNVEHGHKNG
jgi:prepilin-type N-terminal cleavage/methylation domain-containing protein